MVTGAQPMACGNCGHGLFRMFSSNDHGDMKLFAECASWKEYSVISCRQPQPELIIEFGDNCDGRLCNMEPRS